jgi:serine/threonine-protein kinase HipA
MNFEIYVNGIWHPCATVTLIDAARTSRRGAVRVQYDVDYALEHLGARDHRALSVHAPVDLATRTLPHWPSFLIDLLPQGAARKRLERLTDAPLSEWTLLERGAVNPVGNLRVAPRERRARASHPGFELREMIARGDTFVDFATEMGAMVAGATDTQGEAPKFWVVEDDKGRWHPDNGDAGGLARRHMLLKFPVPEAGPRATDILRNEATYQKVAARLGLRVTPVLPEFIDGALLIPRFDRRRVDGMEVRLGVESLYSIAGVLDSAETPLRHHEALLALATCVTGFDAEMLEYVRRDLLNIALGNRDNHGRNTAVLKDTDGMVRLAPLYDFGPAFLDARAIVRVMRWEAEEPGGTDWNRVLENLATRFEEAEVDIINWASIAKNMRDFGHELQGLPALMQDCGVDSSIIEQRRREIDRLARELDTIGSA